MSVELLQRFQQHLAAGNLLTGYDVKWYRWSDQDLNGRGQLILFRMPGTSGTGAHVIQRPDVELTILCDPEQIVAGDNRMLAILRYLRDNFSDGGQLVNMWPVGPYAGPIYLENNRAMFRLVVRVVTVDY